MARSFDIQLKVSCFIFLVIISYHSDTCDGRLLKISNGVASPSLGETIRLPSASEIRSDHMGGGDLSRLIGSETTATAAKKEETMVWRKHGGRLVFNFLPKGSRIPPSGPSRGHN
ncbi:hypothetical protein Droror1_Dr00026416 [Drosera rotundifolia]